MDHNHTTTIQQALQQANQVLTDFMHNTRQVNHLAQAAEIMAQAINTNHKIITCGNGGSHCDAMHFAEELTGKFRAPRKPLPAIAISDPSHLSCTGNDYGFEAVFSRFIEALGQPGDVLLAISTSGNSENILQAAAMARQKIWPSLPLPVTKAENSQTRQPLKLMCRIRAMQTAFKKCILKLFTCSLS